MIPCLVYIGGKEIVFNLGMVERPVLTARDRLSYHRAAIQSFQRTQRAWVTGVNPVMVPVGMEPRVVEVYGGFNIWVDPYQGFYWVGGYEPTFWTIEEARAFISAPTPNVTEPENGVSVIPYALMLGILSRLI